MAACAAAGLLPGYGSSSSSYFQPFFPGKLQLSLCTVSSRPLNSFIRRTKKFRKREEDPVEALFQQLEKDLKIGIRIDRTISEEDMDQLDQELGEMAELEDEVVSGDSVEGNSNTADHVDDADFSDDEEYEQVPLEIWQLRKLASALQLGRRKANIKQLSEEVGLDRAEVLAFLKDPPLELLTMSALQEPTEQETKVEQHEEIRQEGCQSIVKEENPKQSRAPGVEDASVSRMGRKRIKKVHLKTFELVYRKTRRPTNAMIQNLVQLTNIPRKRIVEWFDKRRLQSNSKSADTLVNS